MLYTVDGSVEVVDVRVFAEFDVDLSVVAVRDDGDLRLIGTHLEGGRHFLHEFFFLLEISSGDASRGVYDEGDV